MEHFSCEKALDVHPATELCPNFEAFTQEAQIGKLPAGYRFSRPVTAIQTNDNVRIESCEASPFLFADKLRKDIHEAFDGRKDLGEHVSSAMKERFPLSQDTPLPAETKRAADFVRKCRPMDVANFWGEQLGRLSRLNAELPTHQAQWGGIIDPALKPAAGKIRTLTIRHHAAQCGLGGERWMDQFETGLPNTWAMSQKGVPPPPTHPQVFGAIGGPALLFSMGEARFRERAPRAGSKNAPQLWDETMGKVKKGWLCPPLSLADSGCPDGFSPGRYNIAFRFGVEQAAKLRACDDLRRSLSNSACSVLTPIRLVSWRHLSQLCRRSCDNSRYWALFKADREEAYKQLPLAPRGKAHAAIAPKHPATGMVWLRISHPGIRRNGGRIAL